MPARTGQDLPVHVSRMPRRWVALAAALVAVGAVAVACTAHSGSRQRPGAAASASQSGRAPGSGKRPGTPARPNIVYVLTDDLSTDLVQYMPHVRALAARGTSFSNFFVTDSLCCPSRASILTGDYPHNTRVYYNAGSAGGWDQFERVGDGRKVYGLNLQAAGYRTGFLGKYLNHYPPHAAPPPGWDEWDVTGSQGYAEFNFDLNENGHVHHYGHAEHDYLTDVLAGRARRFIATTAAARRPFALEVATFAPHAPSTPAPIDRGTFPGLRAPRGPAWDRLPTGAPRWLAGYRPLTRKDVALIDAQYRRRVESVQAVDRMIGALESELSRRGLLDDTYFVFSSDNGYHMGQRRMLPGKQTAYDTDIKVPLIVAGPGVPAGRTDPTLTSTIDLAPTFEQIAGAHSPYPHDGVSLLNLWHGQAPPADWSRAVLVEHRASSFAGDPDRQSAQSGIGPSYDAVRTADYLYVEYVTGDREYYDLRRDPDELHNVFGQLSPSRVDALHGLVEALATCRGADCQTRTLAAH